MELPKLIIKNATNIDCFLDELGKRGKQVGGYGRENRRSKDDVEYYVLRNTIALLDKQIKIQWPITIWKFETPDFIVEMNGRKFGVEVTQASPPEDSRERALGEASGTYWSDGQYGGRISKSPESDVKLVIQDIQQAITTKSKKHYYKNLPTDLWVYPNAIILKWLDCDNKNERQMKSFLKVVNHSYQNTDCFKRVIIYWRSDFLSIVE